VLGYDRDIPVCCLHHSFTVHTHYEVASPFPPFLPLISMVCPGIAVFNTGDSLVALDIRVDKTVDESSHGLQFSNLHPESSEVSVDENAPSDDVDDETVTVSESTFFLSAAKSSTLFTEDLATPKDATNTPHTEARNCRERSLSSGKENQLLVFPMDAAVGNPNVSASACNSGSETQCFTYSVRRYSSAVSYADTEGNHMRVIPKVSGLDVLDNNIFHNLYISETYILCVL